MQDRSPSACRKMLTMTAYLLPAHVCHFMLQLIHHCQDQRPRGAGRSAQGRRCGGLLSCTIFGCEPLIICRKAAPQVVFP